MWKPATMVGTHIYVPLASLCQTIQHGAVKINMLSVVGWIMTPKIDFVIPLWECDLKWQEALQVWLKTWEGEIILDYPCGSSAFTGRYESESLRQDSGSQGGKKWGGTGNSVAITQECGLLLRILQVCLNSAESFILALKPAWFFRPSENER